MEAESSSLLNETPVDGSRAIRELRFGHLVSMMFSFYLLLQVLGGSLNPGSLPVWEHRVTVQALGREASTPDSLIIITSNVTCEGFVNCTNDICRADREGREAASQSNGTLEYKGEVVLGFTDASLSSCPENASLSWLFNARDHQNGSASSSTTWVKGFFYSAAGSWVGWLLLTLGVFLNNTTQLGRRVFGEKGWNDMVTRLRRDVRQLIQAHPRLSQLSGATVILHKALMMGTLISQFQNTSSPGQPPTSLIDLGGLDFTQVRQITTLILVFLEALYHTQAELPATPSSAPASTS